ncbi:MAG: hypothetical protein WEB52_02250 [Dehalococcoidia bacterium]
MTDANKRLDRMFPLLNVKERAIMTLHDYKASKPQDLVLLSSTTDKQTEEFNRYIGMMNAANSDLAHVIDIIHGRAKQEELRFYWLESMRIAAMQMYGIRAAFAMSGREPITESAYREREQEERKELIPIDECAMLYTEYHHAWDDADYETGEDGNQQPSDEAWYRVRDAKLAAMREAVVDGTLMASGKGKRMQIECGAFFDWIGAPVAVPPDLGIEYDVRPDERWREVERRRKDQAFIKTVLDGGACTFDLPLDMESAARPARRRRALRRADRPPGRGAATRGGPRELARAAGRRAEDRRVHGGVRWRGRVAPRTARERFGEAKAMLTDLHEQVQTYTGAFELAEPDDELNAMVERIVEREMRSVPTR